MKKLLLAACLFIASDAAFASSSVLSGNNKGSAPAMAIRHGTVVAEPPLPSKANNHGLKSTGGNGDALMALLFRLYLSFAR